MKEIEKRITERVKRKLISQLVHAKNDKEMIATWKLDLNVILHIFNVRSVGSVPPSLTSPLPDRTDSQY